MRKKQILIILIGIFFTFFVLACDSSSTDELNDDGIVEEIQEAINNDEKQQELKKIEEFISSEDDWIIHELSSSEEWSGLTVEIVAIALGSQVQSSYMDSASDAVAINFRLENTRAEGEGAFSIYPDQGLLVTSTGEQVEASFFESDSIGGYIYEGVIKGGTVIWFLERRGIEDLAWVRTILNAYDEKADPVSDEWFYEFDIGIEIP